MSKSKNKQEYNLQEIFEDINKMLDSLSNFEGEIDSTKKFNAYKDNLKSTTNEILEKYNKKDLDSKE